jgi:hypothetical protein
VQFPRDTAGRKERSDEVLRPIGRTGVADHPARNVMDDGAKAALEIFPLVFDDHIEAERLRIRHLIDCPASRAINRRLASNISVATCGRKKMSKCFLRHRFGFGRQNGIRQRRDPQAVATGASGRHRPISPSDRLRAGTVTYWRDWREACGR